MFHFFTIAGSIRSVSALDTAAVQRARARQQYSTMARLKVTAGTASLRKYLIYSLLCVIPLKKKKKIEEF